MTASAKTRAPQRASNTRSAPQSRPPWLWIAIVAFVLIAGVVAVAASRGADDKTTAVGIEQIRPVEVNGAALPPLAGTADTPEPGPVMPELRGQSFDGTPVNVTRDGKAKVVLFVAHWCPHCQREVPILSEYLASNDLPVGVEMITVSTGVDPDRPNYPPSSWLAREDWPGPVLADDELTSAAQAFGLTGYPYFVAVNETGEVVARTSGEITTEQFAALATEAAGG